MPINWAGMTLDEHRGAQSAVDNLFADIGQLGVDTNTHHPEVLELIIKESNRANADRARRIAEVIP
ncbi:hypothetical protein PQI51_03375 [Microbacterium esteraromaticum]|uniref:hypothetical protein n=1 Tax=Microbacterium esteraromaticum TaxID=57043 RepID=UPI0030A3342F